MGYEEFVNKGELCARVTHVALIAAQKEGVDGKPSVALLLDFSHCMGENAVWEGDPASARQLAAALMNEADRADGFSDD